MIRHNLKLSYRVFTRNKFYAATSVLGLSLGFAIGLLIFLFVRFELSYERENPLAHRLVRVTMDYLNGDAVIDQDAGTYPPTGHRIASEFTGVESFTRARPLSNATVKIGNESMRENNIFAVDPSFITLFNCHVVAGTLEHALANPYEMIITRSAAINFFGNTDVLGESVRISWFDQPFKITGIVADPPANTHLKYNVLISKETLRSTEGDNELKWNNNNDYTYFLLSNEDQYPDFVQQLLSLNTQLHVEGHILNERIIAQPMTDIHLYSHKSFELEQNGDAVSVLFLIGVGVLVIIISVLNHINLSTAKSLDRAKEVGVRKVIGSSLSQLRGQFFYESLLINIISAGIAAVLVIAFLPVFRKLSGLPPDFQSWSDPHFYVAILLGIMSTTIVSSIFPSFILAGFDPIKSLKGKFSRTAGGVRIRKVLMVVQFALTMFLLIQTFVVSKQLAHMRAKDLGLDIEQTIVVRTAASGRTENYQVFKDNLLSQSDVRSVTFSGCVPGQPTSEMGSTNVGVTLVGGPQTESFNFYITWVDADFLSTMKISLAAGEDFNEGEKSQDKIIVNEEAIRLWHIPDPKTAVGQRINLWGSQRTIIGVVNNFHQVSPKDPYLPIILFHQEGSNKLASIRFASGDPQKNIELLKASFQSVFPGSPFDFFFLDEEFDKQYKADEQFENVFGILALFAIIISTLGLFGLVSVALTNRTKEIGIRKVLGATSHQLINLFAKDFMGLIVLSVAVSTTLTYFFVREWLDRYAFRIELDAAIFLLPAILIIGISLLTVAGRTLHASLKNPVQSLKED